MRSGTGEKVKSCMYNICQETPLLSKNYITTHTISLVKSFAVKLTYYLPVIPRIQFIHLPVNITTLFDLYSFRRKIELLMNR